MHWLSLPFEELHSAIQRSDLDAQFKLLDRLQGDLANLLVHPSKNDESKRKLESGKVNFSDGSQYELNTEFVAAATRLADELDLDQLVAAETLYHATQPEYNGLGVEFIDLGRAAYHTRRLYVLQIVGYYLCNTGGSPASSKFIASLPGSFSVLDSFKQIEKELEQVTQLVQRSRLLGTWFMDAGLSKAVGFCRDSLYREQQLLGEVLWGYAGTGNLKQSEFVALLEHAAGFQANDVFCVAFLPGLLRHVSSLEQWAEQDIASYHSAVLSQTANTSQLAGSPFKALVMAAFLVHFIGWCKGSGARATRFPFEASVREPLRRLIFIGGALEMLLCVCAETTEVSATPFYDFRSFLQRHIPKLVPTRLLDINEQATNELRRSVPEAEVQPVYYASKPYLLDPHFVAFFAPVVSSSFVLGFVTDAAFVLTELRDTEEDLLLSSEDLDLDAVAENAELERFYVALYYLYGSRAELGACFWEDKSSSSYGFLLWASKCNSPIITSAFCMFLSSLATGTDNAVNTFNFLQLTNDKAGGSNNGGSVPVDSAANFSSASSIMGNFSAVSWSTIYSSLAYYNKALTGTATMTAGNNTTITHSITLGEDSIIFISGFFQVLSEVAGNSERARSGLLVSDDYQLLQILSDFLGHSTPLGGATMVVLSSLVGDSVDERRKVWQLLDNWLFRHQIKGHQLGKRPQDVIRGSLSSYALVSGFVALVSALLKPVAADDNPFNPMQMSFALDLGSRVRSPGIWAYLDVISCGIFVDLTKSTMDPHKKAALQQSIIGLWQRCLARFDPNLVLNASAAHLTDLDNVCEKHSIVSFLQAHEGSAVLCFLYRPEVHSALFEVANLGLDKVNELPETSQPVTLVTQALQLINLLLDRELFFSDELLPILRLTDNKYCSPSDVGTCGLRSLYDSLLLKLPLVANVALYVSSASLDLATTALSLLRKISFSPAFNGGVDGNLLNKNRLLTMFETVDESKRIRFAFMEQFEAPIHEAKAVGLKVDILNFLNANLSSSAAGTSTVTHFLLGFDPRRMSLGSAADEGTVLSARSLLGCLLRVLRDTALLMGKSANVDFAPARLCALTLDIVLKLCNNGIVGQQTLEYVRTFDGSNLIVDLLASVAKVYQDSSRWGGQAFEAGFCIANRFSSSGESAAALTAFTAFRCRLLQLVALELHTVSSQGALSLTDEYVDLLINSDVLALGSPKVLELLDLVEFEPHNMIEKVDPLFAGFDFHYILQRTSLKSTPLQSASESVYDLSTLNGIVRLFGIEWQTLGSLRTTELKSNIALFQAEQTMLGQILTCTLSFDNLRSEQLDYLHAWVLLVGVVVSDGRLDQARRNSLILNVFQHIQPKIVDYLKQDSSYSEDLVRMCVSLLSAYTTTTSKQISSSTLSTFASLASTSLTGILLPQSTPTLRSNFYLLVKGYAEYAADSKDALTELMVYVRTIDQRLFRVACNESLVAEGECRISALLFLEALVKVTNKLQGTSVDGNFLLEILTKSNYLFMLVQKLKSTDDVLCECLKSGDGGTASSSIQGVTLDSLLYEMTASRISFYLLTAVAQSRFGAKQLLNCDVFGMIRDCRFLTLDPDLGYEFTVSASNGDGKEQKGSPSPEQLHLKMSLDGAMGSNSSSLSVSYYDVFVPVFRLVTTVVISLGPQNEASLKQAAELQKHFSKLITVVLKRQLLVEEKHDNNTNPQMKQTIRELSKLFMLLSELV